MLAEVFIRHVLVLYAGGTIGMKKNDDGVLVPTPNAFLQKLKSHPDLNDPAGNGKFSYLENNELILPAYNNCSVKYTLVEYDPLLDSSNMGAPDWIRIASDINKTYALYDGFVVLHGTDTLAYTSSALSFMLEGLNKSVILTGAQISIFESRSDAVNNIVQSLILSGCYDIPEVGIFFANNLLRGNRATKVSIARLSAYESPNFEFLATSEVGITLNTDKILKPSGAFRVITDLNTNVRVIPIFPTITSAVLASYLEGTVQGVVLQTYGDGNIPSDQKDLIDVLKNATARQILIINKTLCLEGSVISAYETGKVLEDIGVIPGYDLTTEAALTKLAFVLNLPNLSYQDKVKLLKQNIRGEMTTTI